jgi:hypothetical protein
VTSPKYPAVDPVTLKLPVSFIPDLAPAKVGLGNVNNTADSAKPVSTAQAAAIAAAIVGQVRVALWDGTAYKVGGVAVTAQNRPGNTFYKFIGGPDPAAITGVGVINGDEWKDAS